MRDIVYDGMMRNEATHWWFVGRRRILQAVLQGLNLPGNAGILEVGAGTGGNIPLLRRFGAVTAIEPNAKARASIAAKTGITAVNCSLPDTTPLRGARFDLIAMLDVLEHIEDATAALTNLAEHLTIGGRFLITVPAYPFLWSTHDERLLHFRRYTRGSLTATITAAGLKASRMRYFNTLLFPALAAARLALNLSRNRSIDEEALPPSVINRLLAGIFAAERHFVLSVPMPFGVSLLAILETGRHEFAKQDPAAATTDHMSPRRR
jgi:SAM-dependent methyltransferase